MQRPSSLTPTDRFAVAWTERVQAHPWLVLLAALGLVSALSIGTMNLGFNESFRTYFGPDNPELVAFDELQDTYAGSDSVLFVVRPSGGEVFQREVLQALESLTEEAWLLPHATRVDSITNYQHSWADGDDLTVGDLVVDAASLTAAEISDKRRIALDEPLVRGLLLSEDASTAGVNVTFQFPEGSAAEIRESAAAAEELAQRFEERLPGSQIELSGVVMLNNAFSVSGQKDAMTLIPAMFGVLAVFLAITLRSVWACLMAFSVVGLSITAALGLAGFLGIDLGPVAVTAPTLIATLAIADSVHILVSLLASMREGVAKDEALREAMRINFTPVSITSLTTIVGFLALNFSDAPPFHDLGNITAMGIAAAYLFSLSVLPAMVTILPMRVRATGGTESSISKLEGFADWVTARHRPILAASLLVVSVALLLTSRLDLDDQWVRYFDDRVAFRGAAEFTDEHLTGLYLVEFSVPTGEAEGISDPEYLQALERFTTWLRTQPEVRHVTSYIDIIQRLNRNLHADDPAYHRIPESRELAAQYLLLYELSLPYGLDLNDRIAVDKSATRVTTLLDGDTTTVETREFLRRAEGWLEANAPERMANEPSGLGVMFAYLSQRNIESMLLGNVLAVLFIAGLLVVALRSVGFGLLSLVPNTVPVLVTFGLWELLSGSIGMAGAMVAASSLGIIVDDTVHFMSKYLRARRERGLDPKGAVRYAMRTVGKALIITTVILVAGFLVLALSTFRINFELGVLTAIAITVALLADFTLLPALLVWRPLRQKQEIPEHEPVPT